MGVLTFWEFSELLELIHIQPLRALDPQLETLLNQPTNFFQVCVLPPKLFIFQAQP